MGEARMQDPSTNLNSFIECSKDDLEDKIVKTISDKNIVFVLKGGKRLRSLLASLSFKACTQGNETREQYEKALEGAVGIELAHAASLVHDDIIDNDKERRGNPSFFVKKGIANAILTGHKMLAIGFDIALKHSKEIARLYIDSWDEVVNGEINEVDFNTNDINNIKELSKENIAELYYKIINQKTAALFSSACKAGAIEANMAGEILKVFEDYGREIGLAYQLADDLVDLVKGEIIDSVIIPLLNNLEGKFSTFFFGSRAIKKKFAEHSSEIEQIYIKAIKKHVRKAQKLGNSDIIPPSKYKTYLYEAPTYIINQMLKEINITV
jgi:geranylgeranyl pyrophosphate synthase